MIERIITVIGRGHSGTRAISHTLTESGVFMGGKLNESGDLIPARDLYDACRVMAPHVQHLGNGEWDFSALHTMPIPQEFTRLVERYLESVLTSKEALRGWKLPETTLIYPWIVRLFPDLHYIYWVRDPRDSILNKHLTDDLSNFGIEYPPTEELLEKRAFSWRYQTAIYRATPKPKHLIEVRFEDFVLDQERTLTRLEDYLGIPLARIAVRKDSVARWKAQPEIPGLAIVEEEARRWGYLENNEDPATGQRNQPESQGVSMP